MDANPPPQANGCPRWSACPRNLAAIFHKFFNRIRRLRIEEGEVIKRSARVEILHTLVRVFGLHAQFEICFQFPGVTFFPCGCAFSLLRLPLPLLPGVQFLLPPCIPFLKGLLRTGQLIANVLSHTLAKSAVEREEQARL